MLTRLVIFSKNFATDFIIKLIVSLLLICLVAPITLSIKGEIPITLQTFIILFCAIAFGWKVGGVATFLYIVAGSCGLPVFADHTSGLKVFGPFGGFFFGFLFSAIVVGYLTELELFQKPIAALMLWFLGHIIIVFFGILWLDKELYNWMEILNDVFAGALIKSAFGGLIVHLIVRFLRGRKTNQKTFVD